MPSEADGNYHCFLLETDNKTMMLQAEGATDLEGWEAALADAALGHLSREYRQKVPNVSCGVPVVTIACGSPSSHASPPSFLSLHQLEEKKAADKEAEKRKIEDAAREAANKVHKEREEAMEAAKAEAATKARAEADARAAEELERLEAERAEAAAAQEQVCMCV